MYSILKGQKPVISLEDPRFLSVLSMHYSPVVPVYERQNLHPLNPIPVDDQCILIRESSQMYLDDKKVRLAAFEWLSAQVRIYGDVLPRRPLLEEGFYIEGQRVPLVSAQGIFKPKVLPEMPLSITTSTRGPYDDSIDPDGLMKYKYRGTDPMHRENVGIRKAMQGSVPLIYFFGLMPGKYLPIWPVFIVGDNPETLTFTVAVDDRSYVDFYSQIASEGLVAADADIGRRAYITTEVKQRLHQRSFRIRVLNAYREQCALCHLKHAELLDAAHIIPDGEPGGEPVISNGIALCKLHHAAYDNFFVGIRPDYSIEIRQDVLEEEDGPMLRHGLKGLHGGQLIPPRSAISKPSPQRLDVIYERFLASVG